MNGKFYSAHIVCNYKYLFERNIFYHSCMHIFIIIFHIIIPLNIQKYYYDNIKCIIMKYNTIKYIHFYHITTKAFQLYFNFRVKLRELPFSINLNKTLQ